METNGTEVVHIPVLRDEVVVYLKIEPGKKYIDTTVGGGGHAEAILKGGGEILGIDFDTEALEIAKKHLTLACPTNVYPWRLIHGNFSKLKELAETSGFIPVDGILFDLGISSYQLDKPGRGFSFSSNELLDMRINPNEQGVTAKDLINGLNEGELYELFTKLGEEHFSRPIARRLCRARRVKPIETGLELAEIIKTAVPPRVRFGHSPATNVFRALRMAVNDELNNLKSALPQAGEILARNGRLVVLSFQSLEDRIVKNYFKEQEKEGSLKILTAKPVVPSPEEVQANPRSRSTKLRAAEKL
ncbi:MAG: 16S rRNA (cytosine(1402)-N(4))-methyltransferase RsmH [bacterium]|nr:16S rRNA (cytosine(1402)-N(4))-methyltransferase RsmH [bacterium]